MEVSLPQIMLQKLLDLSKLESFRPHQEIVIQSIIQDQKDAVICTHIDYHNQHESTALIGLFHATTSVLTSVTSDILSAVQSNFLYFHHCVSSLCYLSVVDLILGLHDVLKVS